MSQRSRAISYLVLLLLVATFVILTADRARANVQTTYNGDDAAWASHGYTVNSGGNQEHRVITVADNECDGHRAYVQYEIQGSSERWSLWDADGCHGGNYQRNYNKTGQAITWMRAGEYYGGAYHWSKWKQVKSHTSS